MPKRTSVGDATKSVRTLTLLVSATVAVVPELSLYVRVACSGWAVVGLAGAVYVTWIGCVSSPVESLVRWPNTYAYRAGGSSVNRLANNA